jgi:membrane protease YdiL (CAAX protease family)
MEFQNLSAKQKALRWLILLSSFPAFIFFFVTISYLSTGIFAVCNGYGFFESQRNMDINQNSLMIVQTLSTSLSVILLVLIYWVAIFRFGFVSIGFERTKGWLKEVALGLATGLVLLGLTFLLLLLTGQIHIEKIQWVPMPLLTNFIVFVLVGFHEELLTRGYLLGVMRKLANKYFALGLVAVLFSLMHIFNDNFSFIPFLNIILAGVLLGVVIIFTGRLWFAMSLHFIWNFLQGPVFGSQVSGNDMGETLIKISKPGSPLLTGGDFGFEGSLLMTLLMIATIITLGFYYGKKQAPESLTVVSEERAIITS